MGQPVDNFVKKVGKCGNIYCLKTMVFFPDLLNLVSRNISTKIQVKHAGRPWVQPNIVIADYENSICWTAINTHLWGRERFVWRYKRTLAMRGLLRLALRAKEIDIYIERGSQRSPFAIMKHPPRAMQEGIVTDYELHWESTVIHTSITR